MQGDSGALHNNLGLVRELESALGRRCLADVAPLLQDRAVWHFPGKSCLAGRHCGRECILGVLGKLWFLADALRFEALEVMASGSHAVAWHRVLCDDHAELEALVCRVEHGRIGEVWQLGPGHYLDTLLRPPATPPP